MSSSEDEQATTIRRLGDKDRDEVVRLAQRDSRPIPEGELLGAESQGRLRAVISLTTGAAVADPFARTEEIMELLRGRLAHLRCRDAHPRNGRPAGFGSERCASTYPDLREGGLALPRIEIPAYKGHR